MVVRLAADEFIRQATSGRTRPILTLCESESEKPLEVFCKVSAGCLEGVTSLAREVLASCLAADLNLPVPQPYLVEISSDLVSAVTDIDMRHRLQNSCAVGFGSARVENQFSAWTTGHRVTDAMLPSALGTILFDAAIQNSDRRVSNPNCLVSGHDLRLIDHELAFPSSSQLLNPVAPWKMGGTQWLCGVDGHIFCRDLKLNQKRRLLNFGPLRTLWCSISDARLEGYRAIIPQEWATALWAVDEGLKQIQHARDNFDGIIAEIGRVLNDQQASL